jgi:beta,beta-carotene 9',10'-dioxygenase
MNADTQPNSSLARYAIGFQTAEHNPHPVELAVSGTIASWISGALLRTAPARFEVGRSALTHWFDGHAMLHRFHIDGGKVTYISRYLESNAAQVADGAGELVLGEYGTNPDRSLLERVAAVVHPPSLTDNCNVNVVARGGEIVALTETPKRIAFDPVSLRISRQIDDAANLSAQIATAHPHYDATRATSYGYMLNLSVKSTCKVVATDDATGRQRLLAEVALDHPPYLHSFGMSDNYLILALPPLVVDPLSMLVTGKPFIRNYHWRPELGLRFVVIDKRDASIVVDTRTTAAFFFHHVNAFEEQGDLVVDMLTYPDADIVNRLDLDRLRSADPSPITGELCRFRIALNSGKVERAPLSKTGFEFPQINYSAVAGKPYRFAYGAGSLAGDLNDCIVKVDLATGDALTWAAVGLYPGEPVFVPDPANNEEDAGVLLTVALDISAQSSWLIVLDAKSLIECARALAPDVITFGFHGGFFPDKKTSSSFR